MEIPVTFGSGSSLLGVVSQPDSIARSVCCIMVTAGLTVRMGPFRLYTSIARALAKEGVATLRFDLDNIGDSGNCYAEYHLQKRAMLEVKDAVDFMHERYGYDRFVLCGLCSGAEMAFRYAKTDERVIGVSMFDPFCYATSGSKWRFQIHRVYRRLLRTLGLFEPIKFAATGDRPGAGLIQYQYMSYDESHEILSRLTEREVFVHFIYTAAVREIFNHPRQFRKTFPKLAKNERVQVDYVSDVTHNPVFAVQLDKMTRVATDRLLAFVGSERVEERELHSEAQMTPRRS